MTTWVGGQTKREKRFERKRKERAARRRAQQAASKSCWFRRLLNWIRRKR